jgi:GT2 family glycosyltransferase
LDAHAVYPEKYFSKLVKWSIKLNADNLGGVWITDVINKNLKTEAITKVLSNRFGVGNSFFRIGIDEIAEVDTVPFGCFRREVFNKVGYFDERLTRDQDIELNKRIIKRGGRIFLVPEIFSTYYARETYRGLAKNNFQTGLWNILTVFFTKRFKSLSIRHFVPLVFVLSLFLPLLFMFWNPNFGFIALFSLTLYSFKLIFESIKISSNWKSFFYTMWAFIILHFSYGIGSLVGIFRLDALLSKRP